MNNLKSVLINTALAVIILPGTCISLSAKPHPIHKLLKPVGSDMTIWYRQPAEKWLEAMPVGNGYMGGMVFGGTSQERIALNESSFWSGKPHDYNDPKAITYFPQIRQLVVDEKFHEAEDMANKHFFGIPIAQQAYEPIGDLLLSFDGMDKVENYRRELNMETGVTKVTYKVGNVTYTREAFMSYPDHVMVVHLTASKPGSVSVQAKLTSPYVDKIVASPAKLTLNGSWKLGRKRDWLIAAVEGDGLKFQSALQPRAEGGKMSA